jgi:hypothetical protein
MKNILLFILFLLTIESFPQTVIKGTITDKRKNPIPLANVYIKDTYDGASSDTLGNFKITTFEEGEFTLIVSYIGYKKYEEVLKLEKKEIVRNIILEEEAGQLRTIVISAGAFEASDEKKAVNFRPLDIVTTAGADGDLYGALNTLPGTQQIGEQEGLFVRGGSSVETKTIIDEMVVLNPYFTSVPDVPQRGRFSPFLFKGTIFSTGGYSAQYGQALSAAVILKSQDLPPISNSGLSLLAVGFAGVHTERWENTSLTVSAEYTNLAPYLDVFPTRIEWDKPPISKGGSIVFRHKTSSTGILKFYGTFNRSDLSLFQEDLNAPIGSKNFFKLNNNNIYTNASYKDVLGEDITYFVGTSYTKNIDDINAEPNEIQTDADLAQLKFTLNKPFAENILFTVGAEGMMQNSDDKGIFNGLTLNRKLEDKYFATFAESDITFTDNFAGRFGVRFENSKIINKNNVAPRISLAYLTSETSQVSFAYGKFYQTPDKQFLYFGENLTYENATHYILNYQILKERTTFRIEGYYKKYDDLIKRDNSALFSYNNEGTGYARGIDIFWRDKQTFSNVDYWVSYSFLNTERDYRDFPKSAQPTFATPHTFSIVYKQYVPEITTSFGLTYSIATGRPYYNPNNSEYLGDRTKSIQNLSLNASYITNISGNFTVVFVSLGNVLGINNIYGYRFSNDGARSSAIVSPSLRTFFVGVFISFFKQG